MKFKRAMTVLPNATIHGAMEKISQFGEGFVAVADRDGRLLGTVTDGDIRRAILKHANFGTRVEKIMHRNPVTLRAGSSRGQIMDTMATHGVRQLPIVDARGRLVKIALMKDVVTPDQHKVMLVAGGLGKRLRSITRGVPKPLVKLGGKPIMETIIKELGTQGFRNILVSLNYKGKMIEKYFKDGARLKSSIDYVKETKRLGTAGALGLLEEDPKQPLVVMNADLLTKVDFKSLLRYHKDGRYDMTVCVRDLEFKLPFGVVDIDGERVKGIREKPQYSFFINAGIYVINPAVRRLIPRNRRMDMPDLVGKVIRGGGRVGSFPIREYWMDVGRIEDYLTAAGQYRRVFSK